MDENLQYKTIKKLVEVKGNKHRCCVKLNCSLRTVQRMIKGYKEEGKSYFMHGNKGHLPAHTINQSVKQKIVDLYNDKYYDANFSYYQELLQDRENIFISKNAVRTILMNSGIISPQATKVTKRKFANIASQTDHKKNSITLQKEDPQKNIVSHTEAHPRRPRCAYFGELVQMDASTYVWFENFEGYLHIAIDDSTGRILGGFIDTQETLNGYYNVLYQILNDYGIPYRFFTDKRTVFEYNSKKTSLVEDDTFTQFGYACKQLGIEIKTSSVPQAKGRVERSFRTWKSRLPIELRLEGVTTIEHANEFLNSYIKKFNAPFALPTDHIKSVFEQQPSSSEINLILARIANRKIDGGHCIRFNNKYYRLVDKLNNPVYHRKGTYALVIEAFDKNLFCNADNKIYALVEVEKRQKISPEFDVVVATPQPLKKYIPPMSHPWKRQSFLAYVKKQTSQSA